jgi:hypothetical protein
MMFSTILINREDPCSTDVRTMLDRLSATLDFSPEVADRAALQLWTWHWSARLLAVRTGCGMPLGCGAFGPRGEGIALRCCCAGLAPMLSMAWAARFSRNLENRAGQLRLALWLGGHVNSRCAVELYGKLGSHQIPPMDRS